MRRAAALGLAALACAGPALGAEGGAIRSGEHRGFSRLVLQLEATTEWSLETATRRATIFVPGKRLDFGTAGIFDLIPRDRIRAVRTSAGDAGTTVDVELGCDCRISTTFVDGRWLALDVADRVRDTDVVVVAPAQGPAPAFGPPPEDPAVRSARESSAVASAEQILIEQIERAASQGLIQLSSGTPASPASGALPEVAAPEPPATPTVAALPALPSRGGSRPVAHEDSLEGLLDHEQIEAVTVFDRDSHRTVERLREAAVPAECLSDARLDVGAWSSGAPLFAQTAPLAGRLVGEFDRPDPAALAALVRLHIRFGFGAEAEALLAGFPTQLTDRALLADLARTTEGRAVTPEGPLALAAPCPGRHGLWLAAGGAARAYHDAGHFATVHAAFSEMAPDLRALIAPGLIGRLIDADRPAEARLILDTAARPGIAPTADLRLAEARLTGAEGDAAAAVAALGALVEANAPNATAALARLVRLAVDSDIAVPTGLVTDLRAAALQHRRATGEAELRGLLAEALAHGGALGPALAEIRAARRDLPETAARFETLAAGLLAAADPATTGAGAYAEAVLGAGDLIGAGRAVDPARRAVATHLLALGLPEAALTTITPVAAQGGADARRIVAEAQLRLGRGQRARAALSGLVGPEAAELRARAFALGGDFGRAMATLDAEGLALRAEPYAWSSGDWARARAAAAGPERLAMASYMAARAGAAENPAPAAAAAGADPARAFRDPLPRLDRPSLGAARRLLANGRQVGDFVQGLLAEERADAATDALAPGGRPE